MRHAREMAAAGIGVAVVLFAAGVVWAAAADADKKSTSENPPATDRLPNPFFRGPPPDWRTGDLKPLSNEEIGKHISKEFAKEIRGYDKDGDGRVSKTELPKSRKILMKSWDTNKDGLLDDWELKRLTGVDRFGGVSGMPARKRMPAQERMPAQKRMPAQESDPEMFELHEADRELEQQTRRMAAQYRQAPESDRAEIKEKLEGMVNKHFDIRQKRRRAELERLEKQLARLQAVLERREKARERLIQQRIGALVGDGGLDF